MAVKTISVDIPVCECQFNDGKIHFSSAAILDDDHQFKNISYYLVSPEDDSEILFSTWVPTIGKPTDSKIVIPVTGNKNTEQIFALVTKYGLRPYTMTVKPTVLEDDEWDGSKTVNTQDVQFTDITPEFTTEVSGTTFPVDISLTAKWWNNDCMSLAIQSSVSSESYPVTFIWSESDQQWSAVTTVDLNDLVCGQEVTLTLEGNYLDSTICKTLPCVAWKYDYQLEQIFSGGCMNTNYQTGLHILHDGDGVDSPCTMVKTTVSGDLLTTFTSSRVENYRSVYASAIRGSNGAQSQAVLIPDVTDNNQYDADVAPVKGTDDFFVVWTSDAQSVDKRVYGRRFTVNDKGLISPLGTAQQISQSNGDYVAPRVVYNKEEKVFFVTWISVVDQEVQSIYLDDSDSPTPTTYQGGFTGQVDATYYDSDLDLHNDSKLDISVFNVKDKILAAYKNIDGNISIFQYTYEASKTPSAELLTTYEVSGLTNFHFAFDETSSKLMVVFTVSDDNSLYGDTIPYFSGSNMKLQSGSAIILNQGNHPCARPFIKRTPLLVDGNNNKYRNFVVAWQTDDTSSIFYNVFDVNYSQLTTETEINKEDSGSNNVRVVVTDNQLVIVFQAVDFDGETLSTLGVLYYVADRTDN